MGVGLGGHAVTEMVCAVVVTHRRPDELATSLEMVTTQSRKIDHLIVVDNDHDVQVAELVDRRYEMA